MNRFRAFVLALFVVASTAAVPLSAAGDVGAAPADPAVDGEATPSPTPEFAPDLQDDSDDRDDDPSTEETLGYVEGYWYDTELPVDDRDGAELTESELQEVVYRSMARVELLRNRTFQGEPSVDIVSRETYLNETRQQFVNANETERLHQNIRFEALFMVDRETDALEEFSELYGGAVAGYYDPAANEIVIVSDGGDTLEMNEVTLGHELLHAQQDQYHDLQSYQRPTRDGSNAKDGLIEGEASYLDTAYEQRCGTEWSCVLPDEQGAGGGGAINWGMYFTIYQPYSDGETFVEHVFDQGGWEAVDAVYEDPPRHSSEIIRPESYGEFEAANVTVADRSSDRWQRLETQGETDYSEFGEAAMAAMLMHPTYESGGETQIIRQSEILTGDDADPIEYDHDYTDGWNGDRLVKYVTDERSIEESGYVWRTEWTSEAEAAEFVDGYLQLLEYRGAEPVEDRRNTFVIEDGYPGAYYLETDGDTLHIVRAPSVDELPEIREGAAPEGEDTVDGDVSWDLGGGNESDGGGDENGSDAGGTDENGDTENGSDENEDGTDENGTDTETETNESTSDEIPGFGFGTAVGVLAAVIGGLLVAGTAARAGRD